MVVWVQSMVDYDYIFKVILIGPGEVGKTSLWQRYITRKFMSSYKLTIGVDFRMASIKIGDVDVKLQLWDTGGQEKFSAVRPVYYRGADGAIVVFDITKRESFEGMEQWFRELEMHCGPIPRILVGNKADLEELRQVTFEEAEAFAQKKSSEQQLMLPYMETSAKDGRNVDTMFQKLTEMMLLSVEE